MYLRSHVAVRAQSALSDKWQCTCAYLRMCVCMLSVCVHVHLCVRVSRVYALVHLWALVCLHMCCSSCVCVQYVWAPVREQWWISLHWCLCTQCASACVVCIQVHALSMCGLYVVCLHPAKGLRTLVPSEKDRGSSALRCPCSDPQGRTWAPGGSSGTNAETLNVNLTTTHQGPHLSPTCYQLRTRSLERKARLAPVLCPCQGRGWFPLSWEALGSSIPHDPLPAMGQIPAWSFHSYLNHSTL